MESPFPAIFKFPAKNIQPLLFHFVFLKEYINFQNKIPTFYPENAIIYVLHKSHTELHPLS